MSQSNKHRSFIRDTPQYFVRHIYPSGNGAHRLFIGPGDTPQYFKYVATKTSPFTLDGLAIPHCQSKTEMQHGFMEGGEVMDRCSWGTKHPSSSSMYS
jgi:hypothetical protein